MANIVLANIDRINFITTTVDVGVVDSVANVQGNTVLLDSNPASIPDLKDHTVFVPATLLHEVNHNDVKVYHELAQYPFFQQAQSIIQENGAVKGVFRLRRVLNEVKNTAVIASDLCVLVSLFGEPVLLDVKHSQANIATLHVIVMIHFSGGIMAHVDYTFSGKESIELEWSGVKQIIEFNSDDMNPVDPKNYTMLPIQYSVDSILQSAEPVDQVLPKFQEFLQVVGGVEG
ncbi:hypothetical protein [Paucisalibacillus sp. EB02]|uniref:hypothetical protein n=1 Tax=Paucisalibacillus sp. EB02 TaxID=1347087 RepID=UPI0004B70EEA|nr:hypothetical protein [Paucisalibacillus sp. EB02]